MDEKSSIFQGIYSKKPLNLDNISHIDNKQSYLINE